jgi:hypothetical protein
MGDSLLELVDDEDDDAIYMSPPMSVAGLYISQPKTDTRSEKPRELLLLYLSQANI